MRPFGRWTDVVGALAVLILLLVLALLLEGAIFDVR